MYTCTCLLNFTKCYLNSLRVFVKDVIIIKEMNHLIERDIYKKKCEVVKIIFYLGGGGRIFRKLIPKSALCTFSL